MSALEPSTSPSPPEKPRSAFYQHLAARGLIGRENPELVRLAKATGFSVEHLFKVALGQRRGSRPLVKSVVRAARSASLTESSFESPKP